MAKDGKDIRNEIIKIKFYIYIHIRYTYIYIARPGVCESRARYTGEGVRTFPANLPSIRCNDVFRCDAQLIRYILKDDLNLFQKLDPLEQLFTDRNVEPLKPNVLALSNEATFFPISPMFLHLFYLARVKFSTVRTYVDPT